MKHACQDCGTAVRLASAKRCRPCWYKALDAAKRRCGCGVLLSSEASICVRCYNRQRKQNAIKMPLCVNGCGRQVKSTRSKSCITCIRENPKCRCACGNQKNPRAQRCRACYLTSVEPIHNGRLRYFNPEQLRTWMQAGDWDVGGLAYDSNVAVGTIRSWLRGAVKPYLDSFLLIAESLGLITCPTCKGIGKVQKTDPEKIVQIVNPAPKPKKPHHWGAEKARDYRQRVKARRAEEAAREERAS